MEDETAGDPMSSLKWTRKSTRKISKEIRQHHISASPGTVARLLSQAEYSLKCNRKCIAETQHPDRNQQFEYIAAMKKKFAAQGTPALSVDSKKKELIGNFSNSGRTWRSEAEQVNVHDFLSTASGIAIPYGIYDLHHNKGMVVIGISHDTPEFAVDSLLYWLKYGRKPYCEIKELLILCDTGGSNGYRTRAWKYFLQQRICDAFTIIVTVCHYPSGASKWNPIEHKMFSHISNHWAGVPLRSYETVLKYIRRTTTRTDLKIQARFNKKIYATGIKISDEQFSEINIRKHEILPEWNYTIYPKG